MTISRTIIPFLLFLSLLFAAPLVTAQTADTTSGPEAATAEQEVATAETTAELEDTTATTETSPAPGGTAPEELSLFTDTPEEGFQLAITLSRKGVTSTQPNRDVLFMLRDVYANDPDALIASSQVIAIHFQTISAANNYWRGDLGL